jgi:hypothetical protein
VSVTFVGTGPGVIVTFNGTALPSTKLVGAILNRSLRCAMTRGSILDDMVKHFNRTNMLSRCHANSYEPLSCQCQSDTVVLKQLRPFQKFQCFEA